MGKPLFVVVSFPEDVMTHPVVNLIMSANPKGILRLRLANIEMVKQIAVKDVQFRNTRTAQGIKTGPGHYIGQAFL